jgi:hypothetical protein
VDESHDEMPERHLNSEELPEEPAVASRVALKRAELAWQRRGYQVHYRDDFLVQLIRRGRPSNVCLVVGLLAMATVVVGWIACRSWLVVSLSATPDGRVIAHRQHAAHPPAP